MASNRVASESNVNGRNEDKESQDENSHVTPPETMAAIAVAAAAAPAATPTDEPPTVETIEDIAEHTHEDMREAIQPAGPQASAPDNGEGSSLSRTRHHRDCIVSRTVNRHPPYLPEAPHPLLGQVWIDHIVRPDSLFLRKFVC